MNGLLGLLSAECRSLQDSPSFMRPSYYSRLLTALVSDDCKAVERQYLLIQVLLKAYKGVENYLSRPKCCSSIGGVISYSDNASVFNRSTKSS